MNDIFEFLSKLKDPVMGLVIVGLFYLLYMKEKYCQGLSITLTKCVTLLEMLTYGHGNKGD
jgi:hypothetical protein